MQYAKSLYLGLRVFQPPVDECALIESTNTAGVCLQSLSVTLQCHLRAVLESSANTHMLTTLKQPSTLRFLLSMACMSGFTYHMGEAGTREEVCVSDESSGSRQGRSSLQSRKHTPTLSQPFCTLLKQRKKSKTTRTVIHQQPLTGEGNSIDSLSRRSWVIRKQVSCQILSFLDISHFNTPSFSELKFPNVSIDFVTKWKCWKSRAVKRQKQEQKEWNFPWNYKSVTEWSLLKLSASHK